MLSITGSVSSRALIAAPRGVLTLTYRVQDSDPFILTASTLVDWGDGTLESSTGQSLPLGPISKQHAYAPGKYVIRVSAENLREPKPDRALYQVQITVRSQTLAFADAPAVVFGPILPATNGFPAPADWFFNIGRDGAVLSSSIRMLMLTPKGGRIMDPNYGTDLGRLVFSLMGPDLESAIRDEIATAVATYEPRVAFQSASIQRSTTAVDVLCEFKSLLSNQPIVLSFGLPTQ